jgi:glycosyltransferase involved in cell wall biosynthesis
LAIAQRQAGHRPILVSLVGGGPLAEEAQAAQIDVEVFHKSPGFDLGALWRLYQSVRCSRADVVHTHNPGVHPYGALAGWLARVPAILNTRHGVSSSRGQPYRERYFRAVLPLTGRVVSVSQDTANWYLARGIFKPSQSAVIWNGIPLDKYLAKPARPGSRRPLLRFGTVGRLVPAKAHELLLTAFARLRRTHPETELVIYGDGPLRPQLDDALARLGLQGAARLAGPTTAVADVLAELDIFVLSSLTEGLPIVILEALAAGLPIVSTRVGGVPEVAPEGEVAWFSPPGDVDALAAAMAAAAGSSDLDVRGAAARRRACGFFSITAVARHYETLYRQLGAGR